MLILYKPWINSSDEVKGNHSTYAEALADFMFDKEFPRPTLLEILRRKLNCYYSKKSCGEAGKEYQGGEKHLTPTNEEARRDPNMVKAIQVQEGPQPGKEMPDEEVALDEENVLEFFDHKWNTNYDGSSCE